MHFNVIKYFAFDLVHLHIRHFTTWPPLYQCCPYLKNYITQLVFCV